jgi:pyruvate/2-oxoglutarate dehydrogenase complex dihydrolipoamide dehydrogenase (E3) component
MKHDYDMVVIGGGAAGLTAAGMSALLGAKTALIEKSRLGGECTWSGCIPSKTLLYAAKCAHQTRTASRLGFLAGSPCLNFARVMEHVRDIRRHVYEEADAPPNLEKLGVEVVSSEARFIDPHTLELTSDSGKRKLSSRYFIIATGSRPKEPGYAVPCLNNETIFELSELPKRLLILGAGPVGMEMAQAFQRLGSAVTLVAPGKDVLAKDDTAHARIVQSALSQEGVNFQLGRKVTALYRMGESIRASLDDNSSVDCDRVLGAIGRQPAIEGLELSRAGIKVGSHGIEIDSHCCTSQKHIWAAGDVTGKFQFTHIAEQMAKVAVTNSILHWPEKLDERCIVWATFTAPEIAHLGASEEQLCRGAIRHSVFRFPFERLDRAITEGFAVGEVKVLADPGGKILGASIVGEHAGEMISEYALAMRNGVRLAGLASTIHPYPTYMLGNRRAADRRGEKLLDSPLLKLLGLVFGYRGERKGSGVL